MKEKIKSFILEKVRNSTTPDRPYYFVAGSGLKELADSYGYNILELIDELVKEKRLYRGLINRKLVIYIHRPLNRKRLEEIQDEFEKFLNK